jgi:DNA-binding NarL/FixJ family response regulator
VETAASEDGVQQQIKVFLLDDHEVDRREVRDMLEAEGDIQVVGEAGTASSGTMPNPKGRAVGQFDLPGVWILVGFLHYLGLPGEDLLCCHRILTDRNHGDERLRVWHDRAALVERTGTRDSAELMRAVCNDDVGDAGELGGRMRCCSIQ